MYKKARLGSFPIPASMFDQCICNAVAGVSSPQASQRLIVSYFTSAQLPQVLQGSCSYSELIAAIICDTAPLA